MDKCITPPPLFLGKVTGVVFWDFLSMVDTSLVSITVSQPISLMWDFVWHVWFRSGSNILVLWYPMPFRSSSTVMFILSVSDDVTLSCVLMNRGLWIWGVVYGCAFDNDCDTCGGFFGCSFGLFVWGGSVSLLSSGVRRDLIWGGYYWCSELLSSYL